MTRHLRRGFSRVGRPAPKAQLNGALAAYPDLTDRLSGSVDMTDPLLWLDGDPTDGRRARPHEPEPAARRRPLPAAARGRRRAAAVTSAPRSPAGSSSALLVGGGAFALGVVDNDPATDLGELRPGAGRRQADRRRRRDLRRRARVASCRSRPTTAPAPGFVVDADGTIVTNAHVVGDASTVQVQFADDETATGRVDGRRPLLATSRSSRCSPRAS